MARKTDDFHNEERLQDFSDVDEADNTEMDDANEETALITDRRPKYTDGISRNHHKIRITWENLNVTVPVKKSSFKRRTPEKIQVLRNVSGGVESGQLLAIMGASGAGKTTLLNVLTARNVKNFDVDGRVCVNGNELGRKITSISAYVQQDDLFLGTLTVREHLVFQALLRLPRKMTRAQKIKRVDEVIFELGLKKCAKNKIGIPGMVKGISGGEAKRLAFASEVLRNPPILFCDEPTTGLDSYMAQSVVNVLQNLAAGGKAILCTIHQPTSDVYKLFDRVMFMAEGRVAYAGSAERALEFFGGFGYSCPIDYNPADFLIHTLAITSGQEAECKERIEKICDEFEKSDFNESMGNGGSLDDEFLKGEDIAKASNYNASWPLQFAILLWRSLKFSFRHRNYVYTKVLQKVILGLFLGLLYLNNSLDQNTIMNYNGALFFLLSEMTFPAIFGLLTILPNEFPLLVREHHNGMYKVSSYYMARVVSFIPIFSLDSIVFVSIAYFMIGLRPTADAFFIALGLSLIIAQCSCAFGALMASVTPGSTALAVAIMTPLETLLFLMAGFFSNLRTIPPYISWVQYISWFKYGYEAYAINQWHPIKNITCASGGTACVKDGDQVLEQLSFDSGKLNYDVGLIFALIVGFNVIGYLALWWRTYRAR